MATETLTKPAQETPMFWRPWPDFEQMRKEMLEMMGQMFNRPTGVFQPSVNMFKHNGNLVVEAAVPGFEKKDVQVTATRDQLKIWAEVKKEKKDEKEQSYYSEMEYSSFSRILRLPAEIDSGNIQAEMKDGVLRVTMPLAHPKLHEERKIAIK